MKLWTSAEISGKTEEFLIIRKEINNRINELIADKALGDYVEWAVIFIILCPEFCCYKEIVRRSLKNKELEFRLEIDYYEFTKANFNQKKKLMLDVLLRSLDLMAKWKDIKEAEREDIKAIIKNEYRELYE